MPTSRKDRLASAPAQISGLKVLIVEDDADCATSMATLLQLHGHAVKVSKSGQPAKDAAQTDEPEVILVHSGPLSASDFALARQISRTKIFNTPMLIAVVGLGHAVDGPIATQDGFDLNLVMPIDPNHIIDALRDFQRLIESHALPGEDDWQDWRDNDNAFQQPSRSPRRG
jgi:DNA-binding response OmpR family regulator